MVILHACVLNVLVTYILLKPLRRLKERPRSRVETKRCETFDTCNKVKANLSGSVAQFRVK